MEKNWTEEQLIDYLAGELPENVAKELTQDLKVSATLQLQYEELSNLLGNLSQLTDRTPSPDLQHRFDQLLINAQKTDHSQRKISFRIWLPRIAAAVMLLISGTIIGWQFHTSRQQSQHLTKLQAELQETKTAMLQLLQNDRTSSRIKAVSLTQQFNHPDPEVISSLDHLLKTDKSPNVRLAAIDALVQFSRAESARQALKEGLLLQNKPVVQIALIHALIQIDDKSALPYLDLLIEREDVMDKVKDEARLGQFKIL